MNQSDAPAYSVAVIGRPENGRVIVKTKQGYWREVETGRHVDPEDFRAGWRMYHVPEEPEPERQWSPGDSCQLIGDYKVRHIAPCADGHATGTVTDVRTDEIVSRP